MDNITPVLAIETSADLCSACLFVGEKEYAEENVMGKHIHSEKIFSIIDNVCGISGISRTEINSIAISIGPGSFTGLRIGMAAVKGIAAGLNLPIIPIPSMDAHAYKLKDFCSDGSTFCLIRTVNRDEVYFSRHSKREDFYTTEQEPILVEKKLISEHTQKSDLIFEDSSNPRSSEFFLTGYDIARWAVNFGKDLATIDHDLLEPNYLKNFVAKVKK